MSERLAPVQSCRAANKPAGTVPWSLHCKAWEAYAAAGHGGQSAERIAERGGFSYREIQCCLAGDYHGDHNGQYPEIEGWKPR